MYFCDYLFQTDTTTERKETIDLAYADAHCHLVPEWFTLKEIEQIADESVLNGVQYIGDQFTLQPSDQLEVLSQFQRQYYNQDDRVQEDDDSDDFMDDLASGYFIHS